MDKPKPIIITPSIVGKLVLLELSRMIPPTEMEYPGPAVDNGYHVKDPETGLQIQVILREIYPENKRVACTVLGKFQGIVYDPGFECDRDELCQSVRHFNEKYTKPLARLMANYVSPLACAPLTADFSYMG